MEESSRERNIQELYNAMQEGEDHSVLLKGAIRMSDLIGTNAVGTEFEVDDSVPIDAPVEHSETTYKPQEMYDYLKAENLDGTGGASNTDDGGGDADAENNEHDNSDDNEVESPFQLMAMKMENLTADGGVKKKILKEGVGPVVPLQVQVLIHYNGYNEYSDEPFDSTRLRQSPLKYTLGCGEMFVGLEVGLRTMRKHEEAQFLISPEYAFGKRGSPPRIPANATLLFEVELLNWYECNDLKEYYSMTMEERQNCDFKLLKKVSHHYIQEGKEKFKQEKYGAASSQFFKAVKMLDKFHPKDEPEENEWRKTLIRVYQNIALTQLKLCQLPRVISFASQALYLDQNCVKALFLKGKAFRKLGEFDKSKKFLLKARHLEPKNKDINMELEELDKTMAKFAIAEKGMYQKMFASSARESAEEKSKKAEKEAKNLASAEQVSEDFKQAVDTQLLEFKEDSSLMELPLPCKTFSVHELHYIMEVAEEMDLDCSDKTDPDNAHIRLCKKRPEGEF